MANNVSEILNAIVGELKQMAQTESVIGKPVTAGDKTLIPVVTLSVGFGAGGGQKPEGQGGEMFGGGGGAGLRIEPTAFIVLDKDGVSLLPAKRGSWEGIIEAIPGVVEKLSKAKANLSAAKSEKSKPE